MASMELNKESDFSTSLGQGIEIASNCFFNNQNSYNFPRLEVPLLLKTGRYNCNFIGAFTYTNGNCCFQNVESIGRFCAISEDVRIGHASHPVHSLCGHNVITGHVSYHKAFHSRDFSKEYETINNHYCGLDIGKKARPAVVGNDVWIGTRASILSGITIGDGAVIGLGAVVTKDVAPYHIVAGNPAKIIGKRFNDDVIEKLLELQWWKYGPDLLNNMQLFDPNIFIPKLEERIASGFPLYKCDQFMLDLEKQTIIRIPYEELS